MNKGTCRLNALFTMCFIVLKELVHYYGDLVFIRTQIVSTEDDVLLQRPKRSREQQQTLGRGNAILGLVRFNQSAVFRIR